MDLVQFKIFPFNGKLQLNRTAPYFPRHNQRDQYIYHIKSPSIEATMAPARSQPSNPHIDNLTLPSTHKSIWPVCTGIWHRWCLQQAYGDTPGSPNNSTPHHSNGGSHLAALSLAAQQRRQAAAWGKEVSWAMEARVQDLTASWRSESSPWSSWHVSSPPRLDLLWISYRWHCKRSRHAQEDDAGKFYRCTSFCCCQPNNEVFCGIWCWFLGLKSTVSSILWNEECYGFNRQGGCQDGCNYFRSHESEWGKYLFLPWRKGSVWCCTRQNPQWKSKSKMKVEYCCQVLV